MRAGLGDGHAQVNPSRKARQEPSGSPWRFPRATGRGTIPRVRTINGSDAGPPKRGAGADFLERGSQQWEWSSG